MRHATAGVLSAFCAAFAALTAHAQSQPGGGHSTAVDMRPLNPVQLLGADDSVEDATQRPALPPRVAQYPLEDDPYERPPQSPTQTPRYTAPNAAASLAAAEEEPGWLSWDETRFTGTYIHDSPDGLGMIDVVATAKIKTGLPGVSIGPQFGAHFLGSGGLPDVPEHLYDASVELTAGLPLGDDWILAGAVSPGVFSDFAGNSGDSFRLPLRLMAFYTWSDTLTLGGGLLYLDRKDVSLLPLVGLSYKPNDHFNADLWFPRPKVSWRYLHRPDLERWVYIVGEFGGGSWGIQRDDGVANVFSYRDYRAMVGVEQRQESGFNWFGEAGLIFNRSYEFDRANFEQELDNTVAMQFGVRF